MSEAQKDTQRALSAARALIDGRDPLKDSSAILVSLDHLVATVLLVVMDQDARRALGMLHEGLVPGVEERIALHASKHRQPPAPAPRRGHPRHTGGTEMTTADFLRCPKCPTPDRCGFVCRCLHPGEGTRGRVPTDVELEDQRTLALAAGGHKDDAGKPAMHLIPPEAIFALAAVLEYGARKYADRNWEKGMDWSRPFAAGQRHLWQWWLGHDFDEETGMSHLWHAFCCIAFLIAYGGRGAGTDDRPHRSQAGAPNRSPNKP